MDSFKKENVELVESVSLPTGIGENTLFYLFRCFNEYIHVLVKGDVLGKEDVIVRVHSKCFFGDILESKRCECGEQLQKAKKIIANEECGILIYLNQEGRGIGIRNKVMAYKLQLEKGMDTVDANLELGFTPDMRDYEACGVILKDYFKLKSVRLLTNNPNKIRGLEKKGLTVKAESLIINKNKYNEAYLKTKKEKMEHIF